MATRHAKVHTGAQVSLRPALRSAAGARARNVSGVIARADALKALAAEPFDLVVIGGGITGAGVALDAASRGYSVALVERDDYSSGTSSRSSKLVHGGLRYLQNFDLGLVREALLERALLVNLSPHLVRPLPLLVPGFEGKHPQRALGMGLNMYDAMATDRLRLPGRRRRGEGDGVEEWSPERHRMIDGDEVKRLLPALASREPTAAYLFYDCQTDDSRLVLTVLGEAERYGAVMVNRCEVLDVLDHDVVDAVGPSSARRRRSGERSLSTDMTSYRFNPMPIMRSGRAPLKAGTISGSGLTRCGASPTMIWRSISASRTSPRSKFCR